MKRTKEKSKKDEMEGRWKIKIRLICIILNLVEDLEK